MYIPPDCKREMSTFHAIVKRLYGAFLYSSDSHETFQGNVWTFQGNVLTFGYPIYSNFICLLIYSGKIYSQFSDFHKWKCKWFRKMSLDFVTAGDQKDVINLFDVPAIPTCRVLNSNIWYLSFFCTYFVEVSNVYTHVLSFQPPQLFSSIKISCVPHWLHKTSVCEKM